MSSRQRPLRRRQKKCASHRDPLPLTYLQAKPAAPEVTYTPEEMAAIEAVKKQMRKPQEMLTPISEWVLPHALNTKITSAHSQLVCQNSVAYLTLSCTSCTARSSSRGRSLMRSRRASLWQCGLRKTLVSAWRCAHCQCAEFHSRHGVRFLRTESADTGAISIETRRYKRTLPLRRSTSTQRSRWCG